MADTFSHTNLTEHIKLMRNELMVNDLRRNNLMDLSLRRNDLMDLSPRWNDLMDMSSSHKSNSWKRRMPSIKGKEYYVEIPVEIDSVSHENRKEASLTGLSPLVKQLKIKRKQEEDEKFKMEESKRRKYHLKRALPGPNNSSSTKG